MRFGTLGYWLMAFCFSEGYQEKQNLFYKTEKKVIKINLNNL